MEILLLVLAVGLILLGAFTTYIIASEIPQKILEHMQRNGRYTGLGEQSSSVNSARRTELPTRMRPQPSPLRHSIRRVKAYLRRTLQSRP